MGSPSAYLAGVRCAACGTELIAGKKFCHACGTRVALTCHGCGATVSPDFRFCPDCGLEIGSAGVHDAPPPATDDALARLDVWRALLFSAYVSGDLAPFVAQYRGAH